MYQNESDKKYKRQQKETKENIPGNEEIDEKNSKACERYRDLIAENWKNTDLTEKMAQQIIKRMDNVIKKMPEAIWQAHERIIVRKGICCPSKQEG